jgi:hypothetical protein
VHFAFDRYFDMWHYHLLYYALCLRPRFCRTKARMNVVDVPLRVLLDWHP